MRCCIDLLAPLLMPQINKVNAIFWDVGGQMMLRKLWENYFAEV